MNFYHSSFVCLISVMLLSWTLRFTLSLNKVFSFPKLAFISAFSLPSTHPSFFYVFFFSFLSDLCLSVFSFSFYLYLCKPLTLRYHNLRLFFMQTHGTLPKLAMLPLKENEPKSKYIKCQRA